MNVVAEIYKDILGWLLACSFGFYGLVREKPVNAKNLKNGQKLFFVSL